ncbi:hypothetical protein ACIA8H_01700 [Streptomyces goshikiensis]|uniref:hypothetical protein n=1 Tax=Streptomyces goshikiensis TaxID=1942 RepID=UPI0037A03927
MRTALRTSIVTAALAGAVLVPAAGSAFAAPAPRAVTSTKAAAQDDRYAGQAVSIGKGMVAVLRNKAEGPEAWIRAVGPQWKPGDDYMSRVLTMLNRQQTTDSVAGVSLKLTKADTAEPVLVVTQGGASKSYPLPKGKAAKPSSCVSEVKHVTVGAGGMTADLTMSPKGPKAFVYAEGPGDWTLTLDRSHPKGPDSYYLRIANPNGAKPVLEWKTQGGDVPVKTASFPALPEGCTFEYKVTEGQTGSAEPAPKQSAATAGVTAQTQARTPVRAQTVVVPEGAVAAGAELPVETVADTDDSTTLAAGAGLLAIVAALGASVLRRRRNHG